MKKLSSNVFKLIFTISITLIAILFTEEAISKQGPPVYVDIYGTRKLSPEDIKNRFGGDMVALANLYLNKDGLPSQSDRKRMDPLQKKIKSGINSMGEFSYLNISLMKFPTNKAAYITIDVVDKEDTQRRLNHFLAKPGSTISDPDSLIALEKEYQEIGNAKYFREKTPLVKLTSCPAFNCTLGFDAPELKKYAGIFNTLVPKNKDRLIKMLREDKDAEKRANATLLLAHIKDGDELIKILMTSMQDADTKVRSSAMQVLTGTLYTLKKYDFPIEKVIDALDRPDLEERNKALTLLYVLSMQSGNAQYIKVHAKEQLIVQLKMEQPYVHDQAYLILQQISGIKFGDRDYEAWENWLNTTKTS
ncbi:MAG: HEAT repeat domain-containing protein [Pseudomonadota bacterium]